MEKKSNDKILSLISIIILISLIGYIIYLFFKSNINLNSNKINVNKDISNIANTENINTNTESAQIEKEIIYKDVEIASFTSTLYDNEEKMLNIYLPGLILAHAVTILVYTKCHLFFNEFLNKIKPGAVGVDVGFGEGFYLLEIMENIKNSKCYGFDISAHSLKFAPRLFQQAGIDEKRYTLSLGDIRKNLLLEDNSMDFAVIAEVIEHITNPENALSELSRVLKKDGLLFLSTVKDSNHMDHITNFPSSEYVEEMIENAGFKVMAKSIQRNQDDFPDSKDISVGLAYVCKKI